MLRRLLLVLALTAFALPAWASCTWTWPTPAVASGSCTAASETPALLTDGYNLWANAGGGTSATPGSAGAPNGLIVTIAAPTGKTLTSGTMQVFFYDGYAGGWTFSTFIGVTLTISGSAGQFQSWYISPLYLPKRGQLVVLPSSLVESSGTALTVFIEAA